MTRSNLPPNDCMFRLDDFLFFVDKDTFASPKAILREPAQEGRMVYCDDEDCDAVRAVRVLVVGTDFEIVDLVTPSKLDEPLVVADDLGFLGQHWQDLPFRFEVAKHPTIDQVRGRVVYGPIPAHLALYALEWWVDDGKGGLMRVAVCRT